jgi:hypothetical protein
MRLARTAAPPPRKSGRQELNCLRQRSLALHPRMCHVDRQGSGMRDLFFKPLACPSTLDRRVDRARPTWRGFGARCSHVSHSEVRHALLTPVCHTGFPGEATLRGPFSLRRGLDLGLTSFQVEHHLSNEVWFGYKKGRPDLGRPRSVPMCVLVSARTSRRGKDQIRGGSGNRGFSRTAAPSRPASRWTGMAVDWRGKAWVLLTAIESNPCRRQFQGDR